MRVPHLPLLTFAALSLVVGLVSWKFRDEDQQARQQETDLIAEQARARLNEFLLTRLIPLEIMRDGMLLGDLSDQAAFEAESGPLLANFKGLLAINWINANGVIQWVTPRDENAMAVGRNLFENAIAGPVLEEARKTHELRMTPPLDLYQGGLGVAAYLPVVWREGKVEGYVNAVFRVDTMLDVALEGNALRDYEIWIRDGVDDIRGNERSFRSNSRAEMLATAVVRVCDRAWRISVAPNNLSFTLAKTPFHVTFLTLGLALAAALAIGLHFHTERHRNLQRAIELRGELEGRLLQAQKMEAVGRLAGGVAHDFNNLLTAILGNADLIEKIADLDKDGLAALGQIRVAGDRATRLTSQLLTISRRQVVNSPTIDINLEIRTLEGVLRRLVREDIEFEEEIRSEPAYIELDPGRLSQIVINLVVNAVDAMPDGGHLVMRTELAEFGFDGQPGPWAMLTVEDSGSGMDELTRSRAIEPFFTTKGLAKGTGLGLATVDGIVTSAGGHVQFETERFKGTKVTVWFPTSSNLPVEPPAPLSTSPRGGVALVVEDEASVLDIAARILTEFDYKVVTAMDGEEAIKKVDDGLQFDLLLTDAVMPRMGGRELLEELRNRDLEFFAVLTSGYPDELRSEDLERLGATFLSKPFSAQTILRAVLEASEPTAPVA